jgi:hypothetical protein
MVEALESSDPKWIYSMDMNNEVITIWNTDEKTSALSVPRCSWDNRYVTYSSFIGGGIWRLHLAERHGSNVVTVSNARTLVNLSYSSIDGVKMPATAMWDSSGEWIFYSSIDGGDWDLFRIRPDGIGHSNITLDWPSNELTPALSC